VADYCRIEIALTPSGLDLSVPTEGTIPFGVQTPWGPTLQDVSVSLLPVLEQMDGRRDGHALLRALADDGHPMEARELCSMLLRLRRRHLIGFRA